MVKTKNQSVEETNPEEEETHGGWDRDTDTGLIWVVLEGKEPW